jgi:hypothetical protein
MDGIKTELVLKGTQLYSRLYARAIIIKILLFIVGFTILFWYIRLNNFIPTYKLEEDLRSIPTLFGAGNFIYSIFTGFIVQTQWTKWDRLIEANRGEITMMRQLFIFAHHFPKEDMLELRYHIYNYLKTYIAASEITDYKLLTTRSRAVDDALVKIDDSMFKILKKHPDRSSLASGYLTRAMEYRERKIQLSGQRLPRGIKLFVYFATASVIFGSLLMPFNSIGLNYYFTIVVGLLAFGVYLIIEDFDDPYRPGNYVLSVGMYRHLENEVKAKLEQRGFNVEKADAEQSETEI